MHVNSVDRGSLFRFLPVCSTLVATATWKGPSTSAGSSSLMSQFCTRHNPLK